MRIYGLTGGTGSGKTEVAERFLATGIPVVDADRIGHALIAPGGAAVDAVRNAFGDRILSCGRIDREKLGRIVFTDADARNRLNAIVHPAIRSEIHARCAALADEGHGLAVVDAALIAEDGQRELCLDGLIVVACARDIRLRRLMVQRGLTEEEANRRIDAQTPPEKKVPLADYVIENKGTLQELHARADALAKELSKGGE